MKKVKRISAIAVLAIAVILILVWQIAIAKCEYLTYKYGDAFERAYVGHTMFRDPDSFKVIEYTDTTAKVYYRSRGLGGDVVYYRLCYEVFGAKIPRQARDDASKRGV